MTLQIRRYPSAYRKRLKKGEMNKTEAEYAQYLDVLKKAGEIESWAFEIETLKIGDDCRYTPDFRVVKKAYEFDYIEFHEVKGTLRKNRTVTIEDGLKFNHKVTAPYIEDDALVKIKAAAEMHPYKFIIVWKDKDKWMTKEIN